MAASVNLKCHRLIHFCIFGWYIFTLWHNCSLEISKRHPGARSYGGRWKYLTFINLVMQTVFFGLCFVIDVVRAGTSSFVTRLRDTVFTVLVFPVGTFVFLSFWLIYAYDRELVYPKYLDDIIPAWLNHAMHTVILPLLLVQLYLQPHRYPSKKKGIFGLAFFSAIYLAWLLWVHHASGIWVYPILAQLSPAGLMLFLAGSALALAPLYLLGERLSHLRWGT
ncbi:androgen dependent TFPI regulating protein 1 isoform X2 [Lepisosteus oculatus]|uniref:androgen dependent TFPI regulating protein 1 isoform X2 n=1 Tax=Lepisosteus oculatus TaxID=7918 RepID=UPI0003EAA747|nr:PREDICTED: androgen-dependent TFPI-regulating protein-like isoform X2 [Lepisosteus oculatus]